MIDYIMLENFKCFRKVEIQPKRITAFVGANGTGKSSVLQAFGLLKQTFDANRNNLENDHPWELVTHGPLVNLANDADLTFGSKISLSSIVVWGSVREGPVSPTQNYPFVYTAELLLTNILSQSNSHPGVELFPSDLQAMGWVLNSLTMVPAIRGFTQPVYNLSDNIAVDVSMEAGLVQQEAQTATNLAHSPSDIEKTSPLLKRITGVGLRADTVPPQSVEVKSITTSGAVNLVSEGFGTNSLIMLLLQLTNADRGATVMIEEPEIHLHPKAQAELASVLAEVAMQEDKQVIMTTHSEHITGRLLTLVAEGTLTPDDMAIYSFEKDEEGVCTAKDLRITPDGTIEGGINDFFETNLEEMNRFVQAQFNRVQPTE